jgi:para-nitrobenzyl esterase
VHSDELGFVWGNDDPQRRWSAADNALSDKIQCYWINFMRTGNPNGVGLPRWAPYAESATALCLRSSGLTNEPPNRLERMQAIDAIVSRGGRSAS